MKNSGCAPDSDGTEIPTRQSFGAMTYSKRLTPGTSHCYIHETPQWWSSGDKTYGSELL